MYLGDTIGTTGGEITSGIKRIRNGWCKLWDLVPLLASRDLPFGAKDKSHSACLRSVVI